MPNAAVRPMHIRAHPIYDTPLALAQHLSRTARAQQ